MRLDPVVRALPFLEDELLVLRDHLGAGGVALDIGASYGVYVVALARLVGPSGLVVAFEPRPRSLAVLRTTRRALRLRWVRIEPTAVSDHDGEEDIVTPRRRWLVPVPGRTFLKGELDSGYYDGFRGEFGGAREVRVRTITLDAYADRAGLDRVDLVKIDVEGAEQRVLTGAERTLLRLRPAVLCEIEDRHTRKYGHSAGEVFGWFAARGYRAHVFTDPGLDEVTGAVEGERNYLFLPVRGEEPGQETAKTT